MSNVLRAIINISQNPIVELREIYTARISINNIGNALEAYIQDAFAGTLTESDVTVRNHAISNTFAYCGNQNNPPDIILKLGDAIEVKKIQSRRAAIPLNSSYPKHKLYADDSRITEACRDCEVWEIKDIIYTVGFASDNALKHLWFVYGDCYAASRKTYSRIGDKIKEGILEIPDIECSETNELGRINKVDPLGITRLRIRGMWDIDNPFRVFDDIYRSDGTSGFTLACIMRAEKFNSFDDRDKAEITNSPLINVTDVEIKNPDNPARLLKAKLITFEVRA